MLIHHYRASTGSYLRSAEARPDPLEHAKVVADELERRLEAKRAKVKDLREKALVALTDAEKANLPPPGKFLIPAFATTAAPPAAPEGSEAFFANGAWSIRPKVEEA